MRLLTFTNLYPSVDQPRHGIFVEERLRHVVAAGKAHARVIALRPSAAAWIPRGKSRALELRRSELRHGIDVDYLRVPTLPLITNWIDPWLWAKAAQERIAELVKAHPHDVIIDAHFLYPDAVAAVLLGRRFGIPVVMTARGSDVNVKCENPIMRRWVRWAAANSSAIITVSRALADRLAALRVVAPIVEVVRNGVDLEKFAPRDRAVRRKEMGNAKRLMLSVGHLVAAKGHAIAIEAVAQMEDAALVVVGTGPEHGALEQLVRKLGVASRVSFLGFVPHEQMPAVYNAADALVLASAREGMPNVVLESLACGTRVAATDVGGIGEIVRSPAAGVLMSERSADGLRSALERLFAQSIPVQETRAYAETLGWSQVVDQQLSVYRRVLAAHAPPTIVATELKAR